jgi:hypothetical protein
VNTPRASTAERTRPGTLLRLVIDGLAGSGLAIIPPEHDDSHDVAIACQGAECELSVDDWGRVTWEHCPRPAGSADPGLTADLATALLTGQPAPHPRLARECGQQGTTFKAIVGLELRARGLDVALEAYLDEDHLDAHLEISVTAPGTGDTAKVCVTDDGCLTWTRDYWAEVAIASGPGDLDGWIADPGAVARSVVAAVTRAMSRVRPGGQGW